MGTEFDFSPETAQQKRAVHRQIVKLQKRSTPSQSDAISALLDGDTPLEDVLAQVEGWGIPQGEPPRKTLPKSGRWYKRRGLRSIVLGSRAKALPSLPHTLSDIPNMERAGSGGRPEIRVILLEEERTARIHSRLAQGLPLREVDRIPHS
jgi:hypothetical protein